MKNRKRLVSILAGVMAAIMVLSLLLSLLPARASALSSSEIKKQINQMREERKKIQEQIKEVKAQYEENEDEIADIVARKNVIDQEIGLLIAQITNINEQIASFNILIADKQDELDNAEARLDKLNRENKERIRTMEEEGELTYWEVLFKANSFSDLLDRLNMVEEIAASDQRRLKELAQAAENVESAQEELELEKADLEVSKRELDDTQAELDAKKEEADAILLELIDKAEELEDLHEGFEMEEDALMQEIAQKEKEYNEAKQREWEAYMATYTTVPPATSAGGNVTNNSGGGSSGGGGGGSWLRPCSYTKLTSPFGNRKSPTTGASTYHQGVDLAAPANTPVYATRSGVVTTATYSGSAGYYVTINHGDGFSSIYMHMTHYTVSPGQAVSAGQQIGAVGKTGISTGYHLHFGISYGGAYVNPCAYVSLY